MPIGIQGGLGRLDWGRWGGAKVVAMPIGIQGGLGQENDEHIRISALGSQCRSAFKAGWDRVRSVLCQDCAAGRNADRHSRRVGTTVTKVVRPMGPTSQCRSAFKAGWDRVGPSILRSTTGVAMPIGIQGGLGPQVSARS